MCYYRDLLVKMLKFAFLGVYGYTLYQCCVGSKSDNEQWSFAVRLPRRWHGTWSWGQQTVRGRGDWPHHCSPFSGHAADCNVATQVPVVVASRWCGWSFNWWCGISTLVVLWWLWVTNVVGGSIEEAKVATRWGCVGVVDDGGGWGTREGWMNDGQNSHSQNLPQSFLEGG